MGQEERDEELPAERIPAEAQGRPSKDADASDTSDGAVAAVAHLGTLPSDLDAASSGSTAARDRCASTSESDELRKLRREYATEHVMPWLVAHLQARTTGLQVFTGIQGALLVADATINGDPFVAGFGLISCVSALLWDERNRDVFGRMHLLANDCAEADLQLSDPIGMHGQAIDTLARSKKLSVSHTWSFKLVIYSASMLWYLKLMAFSILG